MAHPAMGSIPLECILCPKHPKFSDISHLLTHVASKGHLSNQFKLKVRASTDEAARKLVEDFDNWYLIWNVDMLMHNRLNLKDKKRPRTKPVATPPSSQPKPTGPRTNRRTPASLPAPIDTHLAIQMVKPEAQPTPPLTVIDSPYCHSFPPSVRTGSSPEGSYPDPPVQPSSSQRDYVAQWMGNTISDRDSLASAPTSDSFDSFIGSKDTAVDNVEEHQPSENTALKGVLWPGMDIFDSATPERKKQRNQKKNAFVLERIEYESTTVECTEHVWTAEWGLEKSLPITGLPEEDDELFNPPLKSVPRKRGRRRQRRTLGDLPQQPQTKPAPAAHELSTTHDDRLEEELTYGRERKRRRFEIYEDEGSLPAHQNPAAMDGFLPVCFFTPDKHRLPQDLFGPIYDTAPAANYEAQDHALPYDQAAYVYNNHYSSPLGIAALAQWSSTQPSAHGFYDALTGPVWTNREAGPLFSRSSRSILEHDPFGTSPVKSELNADDDDDDRTITAPPSPA